MMEQIWKKAEILNQLSGDEAFLKELLGDLNVLINETLRDLDLALTQGNLPKISALSHTLKGSSGNLGAAGIYQASKNLELEAKAGGAQVGPLVEALKKSVEEFLQEVRTQGYLS